MNLAEIAKKLGDHNYPIGRPVYFDPSGDEYHPTEVHAAPIQEVGKPSLIKKIISERNTTTKGIAITYGGFLGIDIAAAHDAEGVLLLDINPEQKHFWRSIIKLLQECPTPNEFKERFSITRNYYNLREAIRQDPDGHYPSFTENKEMYQKVRHWALNDMIASTDMNILDSQRHHQLSRLLDKAQKKVSVIYLSNIPHYYHPTNRTSEKDFYNSMVAANDYERLLNNQKTIAGNDAKIVHSVYDAKSDHFHLNVTALNEFTSHPGIEP